MSGYWVERVKKGNKMSNVKLKVGDKAIVEYFINNGKIMVKRHISVINEDKDFYYVDTGYLRNTPIYKKNIIKVESIL
jgi:hypothetical protein